MSQPNTPEGQQPYLLRCIDLGLFNRGSVTSTSSVAEKNALVSNSTATWIYESLPFYAYPTSVDGTIPIYRYAGITDPRCHLFTSATVPSGYVSEGVGFYAYGDAVYGSKPVYRFNSKHGAGSFLTINESEKANAISALSADWSYDGIAFYSYQSLFDGTSTNHAFKLDFPSYSSISGYVDGNEVDQITKFDDLFRLMWLSTTQTQCGCFAEEMCILGFIRSSEMHWERSIRMGFLPFTLKRTSFWKRKQQHK